MLDFDAYSFGNIQTMRALFSQCRAAGIDSVEAVDKMLDTYIEARDSNRMPQPKCPVCGSFSWWLVTDVGGVTSMYCKDCEHFAPVEEG